MSLCSHTTDSASSGSSRQLVESRVESVTVTVPKPRSTDLKSADAELASAFSRFMHLDFDDEAAEELIAHGRSVEEICSAIGADYLIYQDLDDLIHCSAEGNPSVDGFDCSVFDGAYITGDVDERYLKDLSDARNDAAKARGDARERAHGAVVGIYNDR